MVLAKVSLPAAIPEPAPFGVHKKPIDWIGEKRNAVLVAAHEPELYPGAATPALPVWFSIPQAEVYVVCVCSK